ncbi:putative Pyrazinamidase/nicotinamidase [Hypsibius exemplaris]|uniref:nicotinamidase n=1 Tax=Hypsibius exemplaris TaxID=2072580 RepID=A0A1W0WQQ0_HYPEX|nr:putative Pyrazinamidase/nicotinamidase [Hypsibius exemplaris]
MVGTGSPSVSTAVDMALKHASERDLFISLKSENTSPVGISADAFTRICEHIFTGEPAVKIGKLSQTAYTRFDRNADGILDENEFHDCFATWIQPTLNSRKCLLIVDVQNDFITGTLALKDSPAKQDAAEVVPVINRILADHRAAFDTVVYTQDWHPADHCSFVQNVKRLNVDVSSKVQPHDCKPFDIVVIRDDDNSLFEQALFPAHCVQNSFGAEFHPDLKVVPDAVFIRKGVDSNVDSFSAFKDNRAKSQTELDRVLSSMGVTDVYCCGLATDYCVGSSALDALQFGYRTVVISDACRGCADSGISHMQQRIKEKGGCLINSTDLPNLLNGSERSIILAEQGLSDGALERVRMQPPKAV